MAEKKIYIDYDRDFKLLGIASSERDYKLCYQLTTLLDWKITRLPQHEIELRDRSIKASFSLFKVEHEQSVSIFYLFGNKSGSDILLPEAADFDYLIKTTGSYKGTKEVLKKIKQIANVLTAAEIPIKKIKNFDRLQYEEPVEENRRAILKERKN